MAIPLAPIAGLALRYGSLALAAYAATRRFQHGHMDQRADDAMDDTPDGVSLRRDGETSHGAARLRRVVRLGESGPAFEIDAAALGRIRMRRL